MNLYNRVLWSELKLPHVTVRVRPQPERPALVYRITSIADVAGKGRTAILSDIDCPMEYVRLRGHCETNVPSKIGKLSLIYTRGKGPLITNVERAIECYIDAYFGQRDRAVERIVPDVLRPGDFLVFRKINNSQTRHIIQTYRAVPIHAKTMKNQNSHTGN